MKDDNRFPHPVYRDTVLAPLFEGSKAHFAEPFQSINRAHLVMLAETGIVARDEARAIAGALSEIDEATDLAGLDYTGEHEDYFFLVEASLSERLGPDIAGRLHTARSRNDMDHTAFRMVLKARVDDLLARGTALASAIIDKATRERDTTIVAYTHGQPAQPTTFGHYLAAIAEVLLRDLARVRAERRTLDLCPMGAAAITTTGFLVDRARMAALLGFREPARNSYGAIAAVDYVTGTYSAVKLLFLHLGRVIQDLQFWTAYEVGQLHVPDSLVQISSIMPQKRNPVPIEHLRLLSSLSVGRCDTIVATMHNTPFTDMNDSEGEIQIAGYAAFESGGRALDLLAALVRDCSVRSDRVAQNIEASCITITELADGLVRDEDLSFRRAHRIAAATARQVLDAGKSLDAGYDEFAEAYTAEMERNPRLTRDQFATAVSPENFIAVRDSLGGPAPGAMNDALDAYRSARAKLDAEAKADNARQAKARTTLSDAFAALME